MRGSRLFGASVVALFAFCVSMALAAEADPNAQTFLVSNVAKLTDETFEESVSRENWFVEFFAPWCHFCKKLAPIWEEIAADLDASAEIDGVTVHVAQVDCTVSSVPCNKHDIRGYPTLLFFRDGVEKPLRYEGARDRAHLSEYARKAAGPVVTAVDSLKALGKIQKNAEVVFVYAGNPVGAAYASFSAVASDYFVTAGLAFARVADAALISVVAEGESPHIFALKDGGSVQFDGEFTEAAVRSFFVKERFPRVAHLEGASYNALWNRGSPTVMLVADPADARTTRHALDAFRTVAKEAAGTEQFAWMDGAYFSNKVRTTWSVAVSELPVVIYEAATHNGHAILRASQEELTEETIKQFVENVRSGKIEFTERSTGGIIGFFKSGLDEVNMAFQALYSEYPALAIMSVAFPAIMIFIIFLLPGPAGREKSD